MMLAFIHTYSCPCGGQERGCLVATVRVNKNSLVQSNGIGAMPPKCRACQREFQPEDPVRITIAPEDVGKLNDYRRRKGWPLFAFADEAAATSKHAEEAVL